MTLPARVATTQQASVETAAATIARRSSPTTAGRIPDAKLAESFQHAVRLQGGKYLYHGVVFANRNELKKFRTAEEAGRINSTTTTQVAGTVPQAVGDLPAGTLEARVMHLLHKLNQKLSEAVEKQLKEVDDLAGQVDQAIKNKQPAEAMKTDLQTALIGLSQLMEQRKAAFEMASNMLKSLNETSTSIVRNIRP